MLPTPSYSLNATIGMLVIGIVFTTIGSVYTYKTFLKGVIIVDTPQSGVIISEKISHLFPLRFNYFYALIFSLAFGPLSLLIGIVSLSTFLVVLFGSI